MAVVVLKSLSWSKAVVNPLQAFFNGLVYRRKREHISIWPFKRSENTGYEDTPLLVTSSSSEDRHSPIGSLSPRYFGSLSRGESGMFGDSWKKETFVK
ncbi:hypothetical protein M8J77_001312 [Diaphorina citri]|nr:hypothetical protein M8J77_001312 [Diaphorina citri]